MAVFLRLHRLTEKGSEHLQNIERNLREVEDLSNRNGAKLLLSYACLGEFDAVSIVESSSEEKIKELDERLLEKGMIQTITLKCMTLDELSELLQRLSTILEGAKKKLQTRGLERRILKSVEKDILTVKAYEALSPALKEKRGFDEAPQEITSDFIPLVLVVDDEPDFLFMMEKLLSKKGYHVVTALNGEEALSKAQTNPPDMVILDIMMPGMTGLDVARRIRDHPETKDATIIMLSVIANEKNRGESLWQAGADFHLSKPFDSNELLSILDGERKKHANRDKIRRVLKAMELEKKIKDVSGTINPKVIDRKYRFLDDLGV